MLTRLLRGTIAWSVRHARAVLAVAALLTLAGAWATLRTPVDAERIREFARRG